MVSEQQKRRSNLPDEAGFTLIELLVAMTIFSFILMIVVAGFITVMRLKSQALAYDQVQDSSRTAVNELVRAIRDSAGVVPGSITPGPNGRICLSQTGSAVIQYYVTGGVLTRSDNCSATPPFVNAQAITNNVVQITRFEVVQENTQTPTTIRPELSVRLTVASNNGTAVVAPDGTATCGTADNALAYCAVANLTSGAVPR